VRAFAHPTVLRHCEERLRRSNPAFFSRRDGLLRFARNDEPLNSTAL
jgi:hypothetical protein